MSSSSEFFFVQVPKSENVEHSTMQWRQKSLLAAWNSAMGFFQFKLYMLQSYEEHDLLLRFLEDRVSKLPTVTVIPVRNMMKLSSMTIPGTRKFISHRFDVFVIETKNGGFQTIANGQLYDPLNECATQLVTVHDLNVAQIGECYQCQFKTSSCQFMADMMTEFHRFSNAISILINNKGKSLMFVLESISDTYGDSEDEDEDENKSRQTDAYSSSSDHEYGKQITLRIPELMTCFHVVFDMRERTSELHSLMYEIKDPQISCRGLKEIGTHGISKWLISVLDQINSITRIKYCTLIDASTLNNVRADCMYAKNHNGLSFYNSLGFLAFAPSLRARKLLSKKRLEVERAFGSSNNDVSNCIPTLLESMELTNKIIEFFCAFWSTREHLDASSVCSNKRDENIPAPYHELVKFYGDVAETIDLFIPYNKYEPAIFSLLN